MNLLDFLAEGWYYTATAHPTYSKTAEPFPLFTLHKASTQNLNAPDA